MYRPITGPLYKEKRLQQQFSRLCVSQFLLVLVIPQLSKENDTHKQTVYLTKLYMTARSASNFLCFAHMQVALKNMINKIVRQMNKCFCDPGSGFVLFTWVCHFIGPKKIG